MLLTMLLCHLLKLNEISCKVSIMVSGTCCLTHVVTGGNFELLSLEMTQEKKKRKVIRLGFERLLLSYGARPVVWLPEPLCFLCLIETGISEKEDSHRDSVFKGFT